MLTNPKIGDVVWWWIHYQQKLCSGTIKEYHGNQTYAYLVTNEFPEIVSEDICYPTRREALAAHVATLLVARKDALKRYREATKAWRDAAAAECEALMQEEKEKC